MSSLTMAMDTLSSFSHMQKYVVHKGDRIERGQLIGFVGNTGRSTGPHLHYEIALNNKPINPYKFYESCKFSKSIYCRFAGEKIAMGMFGKAVNIEQEMKKVETKRFHRL